MISADVDLMIIFSGLDSLLDANRMSDLSLLYSLFMRTKSGLFELCQYFCAYIKVGFTTLHNLTKR